jgi:hypothetical protein
MYAIYFDYTGAGRQPEPISGPFDTKQEAIDQAEVLDFPLTGDDYFVAEMPNE